jgi:predicted transcriptional regulator
MSRSGKTRNAKEHQLTVTVEPTAAFFRRGRAIARRIDRGQPVPASARITFEDAHDFFAALTHARIRLLEALRETRGPLSITAIAGKVRRHRSVVSKDIGVLNRLGMVRIEEVSLPGHGKQKLVSPAAHKVELMAVV